MTKTPDEIKKGLECCSVGIYENFCNDCPYYSLAMAECPTKLKTDALALIQQLEDHLREATKKIQQLEAERDAVVKMLKDEIGCKSCAKYTGTEEYVSTDCLDCLNDCNWEWRGVQKEE